MRKMKKLFLASASLLVFGVFAQGQPETNVGSVEVTVIDQYKASIKAATKIANQPDFVDTTSIKLPVKYSINPQMLSFVYKPALIQPVKVSGVRLGKLPANMVKLGAGNYGSALADIILSNSRSAGFNWDVSIKHFSSQKGVKNIAYDKSPFMENELKLGGRWVLKDYRLKAKAGVDWNSNSYYGVPDSVSDGGVVIPDLEKNAYQRYFGGVEFDKVFKKEKAVFQKAGINYHYFSNNWKTSEHLVSGKTQWLLPQKVEDHLLGAELNADFQSTNLEALAKKSNQLNVQFFPKAVGKMDWLNYTLGLNFNFYNTTNTVNAVSKASFSTYFFPEIALNAELVRDVLGVFGGWTGHVTMNGIYSLTKQNPFMLPGLTPTPTAIQKIYAGAEGAIAKNISYKVEGGINYVRSMPLFYRSGDSLTQVYDGKNIPAFSTLNVRGNYFNLRGELTFNSKNVEVSTFAELFKYNLYIEKTEDLDVFYHLPTLRVGFDYVQRIQQKVELKASLAYVGGRKALAQDSKYYKAEMKNIWDARLGLGYNINNNLSASLDVANLASQQYDLWLGYPAQKIRVMLSLTYKF